MPLSLWQLLRRARSTRDPSKAARTETSTSATASQDLSIGPHIPPQAFVNYLRVATQGEQPDTTIVETRKIEDELMADKITHIMTGETEDFFGEYDNEIWSLTTSLKDPDVRRVLCNLFIHGAAEENSAMMNVSVIREAGVVIGGDSSRLFLQPNGESEMRVSWTWKFLPGGRNEVAISSARSVE
jgi:hypothetical protein